MSFTAPPSPPSSSDPDNFDTEGDAFIAWLPTFVTEMNVYQAALVALAAGTATSMAYTFSSTITDSDPGAGYLRLDNFAAQTSATVVRLDLTDANGATQTDVINTFDDSTSTIKGFLRISRNADPTKWLLFSVSSLASPAGYKNVTVVNIAGSAAAPFANSDSVNVDFVRNGDKGDTGAGSSVLRVARTSDTILSAAEKGKLIDVTSGTFTQTVTAAATLTDGWWCYYRNSGTGDVTLDANASETINGLTSFVMYPGEARLIQCDGSNFTSVVISSFYKVFTASGTFVKPPGYMRFSGKAWGAGGSGAKHGTSSRQSGGGGAACNAFDLAASAFAASETITVATAPAGPAGVAVGVTGGNTTIGALVTAYGGGGGFEDGTSTRSGGSGGGLLSAGVIGAASATTGGAPNYTAETDDPAFGGGGSPTSGNGKRAVYGGGGGGATNNGDGGSSVYGGGGGGGGASGTGGTSKFGGAGGAAGNAASGGDGTAPGGGGGATVTGTKAGDGARGEVRIWGM